MEESKKLNLEFQGNIILVLFLNAIIKPLYLLGIDRGVQNMVPPEDYGVYFTLFNLSFIFQIFADFGLKAWLTKTIAQNPLETKGKYPYFLSLKGLLSLLYFILTGMVAYFLGFWSKYPFLFTLILCSQIINSFLLFLRATISGLGFYRFDSYLSITDRGISILIMGFFLCIPEYQSKITIILFSIVQLSALLLSSTIAIFFLRKNAYYFTPKFDFKTLKTLLLEGLPYAVLVLLMSMSSRIDTLIIPFFSSEKFNSSAIYAGSFRILEAINIVGYLFAGLLLPMFSKSIKQFEITAKLANMAIRLLLSIIIPLAISFSILSESIIPLLYKNASHDMVKTFSILILTLIPMSGNYIYGTLLTATGSLWAMNRIFVLILVINIVLIILLLPVLSIPGVALASLITQSMALFLQINFCLKMKVVKFSISLVLRIIIFSLITGLSIISMKYFLPFTIANLPLFIPTVLSLTGIAMVAAGMINLKEWRHLYYETIS